MSNKKKPKIAIITNIPTPYRKNQWEYFSKFSDMDITIFYCAKTEKGRYWNTNKSEGIKEVFLRGLSYNNFHFNPGILKVIFQDYDVFLIGGYGYPSVIIANIALKFLRKRWIMFYDGISPLNLEKKSCFDFFRKIFISNADAYFVNGTVSKKYFKKFKVPSEKIFNQYMTVDVDYFREKKKEGLNNRSSILKKFKIKDDSIIILYVGRIIKSKGIETLINSTMHIKKKNEDISLLLVGDGKHKNYLENKYSSFDNIIFTGHMNPHDLYKYYYAADIFVLPTYNDPWGLVVNEAMSCGLPIIVTEAAGCHLDLVQENGFVVKSEDVEELSNAIELLIDSDYNKIGVKSYKKILKWTYNESLISFTNMIKKVFKNE